MHDQDHIEWWIAVPLAIVFTITYLVIRHQQNKKENR